MRAELVVDARDLHGEGVLWSAEHGLVMWTDMHGLRIWSYDPVTGRAASRPTPIRLCCFAPRRGRPAHEIVAAFADGLAFFDTMTGVRQDIVSFEPETPATRFNDGRTDRQGRLIAGGMDEEAQTPISSVWRLAPDLAVERLIEGVRCANSTCFSPDGRLMYFADSPMQEIVAYPYEPATGRLGERRLFAKVAPGLPDGSCVDAEGCLWNAVWDGGRVERWSPGGERLAVVEVPTAKTTCCAFGGADLGTLFITTSRLGMSDDEVVRAPGAGGLFALEPGVCGLADAPFGG